MFARGNTRDLRVLWPLGELGLSYEIVGVDHPITISNIRTRRTTAQNQLGRVCAAIAAGARAR